MYRMVICSLLVLVASGCQPPKATPKKDKAETTKPPVEQAAQQAMQRVKAQVGVGAASQKVDKPGQVKAIIQPARTFFRTKERIVFEIQIPQAMNLYRATNGDFPKSHEEFMKQIIEANRIQLPELPAGQRYVYDPEKHELMVEKPSGP